MKEDEWYEKKNKYNKNYFYYLLFHISLNCVI